MVSFTTINETFSYKLKYGGLQPEKTFGGRQMFEYFKIYNNLNVFQKKTPLPNTNFEKGGSHGPLSPPPTPLATPIVVLQS